MPRTRVLAAITAAVAAGVLGTDAEPAGAASANVAALQSALRASGLRTGPIDGISGPLTQAATRRFQRRHRLEPDGVAGPQTRRALGRRGRPALGSRTMSAGDEGWDVAALQFILAIRGYRPGGVDGGFGANTEDAVRRFQSGAGLSDDGIAGEATLAAMRGAAPSSPRGPVRFLRPVSGSITDGFGYVGGRNHTGVDIPAGFGTPVRAAGAGAVSFAGWNDGGYGNLVVVSHRLGFESWYAHLSEVTSFVGESVSGGTRLGLVGSTGRSTGPHLHFEVRRYGTPIDPVPYLLDAVASHAKRAAGRRLACRANADAWGTRDADPFTARFGRCP